MPYKDADERRAYYREWKKSPAKRRADKFYSAARNANRRAARLGVAGTITTANVRAVLDGASCSYCGSTEDTCIDHAVALRRGGLNILSNLVASCRSCNARKAEGPSPDRWANDWDACTTCGLTDHKHAARGQCTKCWHKEYDRLRYLSRKRTSNSKS